VRQFAAQDAAKTTKTYAGFRIWTRGHSRRFLNAPGQSQRQGAPFSSSTPCATGVLTLSSGHLAELFYRLAHDKRKVPFRRPVRRANRVAPDAGQTAGPAQRPPKPATKSWSSTIICTAPVGGRAPALCGGLAGMAGGGRLECARLASQSPGRLYRLERGATARALPLVVNNSRLYVLPESHYPIWSAVYELMLGRLSADWQSGGTSGRLAESFVDPNLIAARPTVSGWSQLGHTRAGSGARWTFTSRTGFPSKCDASWRTRVRQAPGAELPAAWASTCARPARCTAKVKE